MLEISHAKGEAVSKTMTQALSDVVAENKELRQQRDELIKAIKRLDTACDVRAGLCNGTAYLAQLEVAGMKEALSEVDSARREARQVIERCKP